MPAELQLLNGPYAGNRITLSGDPLTLGSEPQCDVVIPGLLPVHARIYRQDGRWYLIDYAAHEPKMKKGFPVGSMPARISNQDVIELGELQILFSEEDPSVQRVKLFPKERRADMIRTWQRSAGPVFWWSNAIVFFCSFCCVGIPEILVWFAVFYGAICFLFNASGKEINDQPLRAATLAGMIMSGLIALLCAVYLLVEYYAA